MNDVPQNGMPDQDLLKQLDFFSAAIDSIFLSIFILDAEGDILFFSQNQEYKFDSCSPCDPNTLVGLNYIEICAAAEGQDAAFGLSMAEGLRSVINGELESFELEYPCHGPDKRSWFLAKVRPFTMKGQQYFLTTHQNVTDKVLAEQAKSFQSSSGKHPNRHIGGSNQCAPQSTAGSNRIA